MINILFCSDDKYASKLVVALSSLLDSNIENIDELNIIIRTNDMTKKTILGLREAASKYGMADSQLNVVYTDKLCERLEKENVKKFKNSYLCYFKLFGLDELTDVKLERLLVIDCDTIICDSLKPLYELDLHGKAVGAVREFRANHTSHDRSEKGEYNTGVLLFDMKKYSELKIEKRMKECIDTIPENEWNTGDQTIFTLSLESEGLVETLPLRYNFIINQLWFSYRELMYIRNMDSSDYYAEAEYESARKHPCIMHLISGQFIISPWYYEGDKRIKAVWDGYIENTVWGRDKDKVYQHLPLKTRINNIIFRIIYRCIPRRVCMWICRKVYWRTYN